MLAGAVEGMRKGSFRGAPENSSCGGSLRMTRDSGLCWRVGVSRRGGNLPRPGVPPEGGMRKGVFKLRKLTDLSAKKRDC